jgi:hypothetical protein
MKLHQLRYLAAVAQSGLNITAAAQKRSPGFAALDSDGRATAVARMTGLDATALAVAITAVDFRRVNELRSTVALLEAARRQLQMRSTGPSHGTD